MYYDMLISIGDKTAELHMKAVTSWNVPWKLQSSHSEQMMGKMFIFPYMTVETELFRSQQSITLWYKILAEN